MAVATVDDSVLDLVRKHMREVKVPGNYDRVYKDECMFCFASPESPGGLYINLATHQAFDEEHMELDQQRTSAMLYLHRQARRVSLPAASSSAHTQERAAVARIINCHYTDCISRCHSAKRNSKSGRTRSPTRWPSG